MGREIRAAIRRLWKERALALAAILTLALGIGACTAMFSIVEAVLLKSMDIAQPNRLVVMWPQFGDTAGEFTYNAYRELGTQSATFDRVALTGSANWPVPVDILLPGGGRTRATQCAVSDTFFDVLGARPLLGRTFQSGEDRPGAPLSIVVSHAFWTTKLGGDPAVVGRTLMIGQDAWRIIGVMPPEFFYPAGADFWTPASTLLALTSDRSPAALAEIFDTVGAFHVLARLRPGVSAPQAQASATRGWLVTRKDTTGRVSLTPLVQHIFGTARQALWLLLGAVGLVLVIACANVAGLLLALNALRSRELTVRRALGATTWQLLHYSLAEAGLLAGAGGVMGIAIASAALRWLITASPATVVRLSDARVDTSVLVACLLLTGAVTVCVAAVPAMRSRKTLAAASMSTLAVREPGRGIRSDTRRALVVAQVAITLTLLVASALTTQSLMKLAAVNLGFDPAHVLSVDVSHLDQSRYSTDAARQQVRDELVTRLGQLPGAQSAATVLNRPFAHGVIGWDSGVLLEGQPDVSSEWLKNPIVNYEAVTPDYFESMSIRLHRGRVFASTDRPSTPPVAIISENLAARLWPGRNPIGLRLGDSFGRARDGRPLEWRTVVGVVADARYREIDRARFDFYVPVAQAADFNPEHIVVKTASDPRALIPSVAAVLSSVDPQLGAAEVTLMADVVRDVRAPWRFNMLLFGVFAGLSVTLTVIGVAGLVISMVNWRRREIGVRLALGARPVDVVRLIARQGASLIVSGVVLGVLLSMLAARLLSSLLFGIAATDSRTLTTAAAIVLTLGLVASYLPARRAARLDPSRIFRED